MRIDFKMQHAFNLAMISAAKQGDYRKLVEYLEKYKPAILALNQENINGLDFLKLIKVLNGSTTTTIRLHNLLISDKESIGISEALIVNSTIKELDLHRVDFTDTAFSLLMKALKKEVTITKLCFRNTKINLNACKNIASMLEVNLSFQSMSIIDGDMNGLGAIAIAQGLKLNQSLRKIVFINNPIGDEGGRAIVDAIKENKNIEELGFDDILFSSDALTIMMQQLKHHPSLSRLDLHLWNKVGQNGHIKIITDALQENTVIEDVFLGNYTYDEEDNEAMINMLTKNQHIRSLHLGGMSVGGAQLNMIIKGLAVNKSLRTLFLSNHISLLSNIEFTNLAKAIQHSSLSNLIIDVTLSEKHIDILADHISGSFLRYITVGGATKKLKQALFDNCSRLDSQAQKVVKELTACATNYPNELIHKIVTYMPSVITCHHHEKRATEVVRNCWENTDDEPQRKRLTFSKA